MTREEYGRCFMLLDEYARTRHNCFVTEFDLAREADAYNVCFRPLGADKDEANHYACKYVQLDGEDVRTMASGASLPVCIAEVLDKALTAMPQH